MSKLLRVAIVLFGLLLLTGVAVAQTSWLPDWGYRRPITITNSSGQDLIDYQVLVTLDSSFDFTLSDGSDLRVTDGDGTTRYPSIESGMKQRRLPEFGRKSRQFQLVAAPSISIMATREQPQKQLIQLSALRCDWNQFTYTGRNRFIQQPILVEVSLASRI
jgi:hypothetical protein